jgi:hypothetical protein
MQSEERRNIEQMRENYEKMLKQEIPFDTIQHLIKNNDGLEITDNFLTSNRKTTQGQV